ncbi:MAG: tRNA pseudouridine(55) synthase [uncultured Thermomicrobiales bacterium]|jgi:tRNA pseudouridine55 synthase|uniref:tRNA pseudouridine synthase B n=1 Tax=uncultured Thermomicrobiales bacterium TaxID=1645740 RepID=A0A6J4U4P5_9BACT|nr:MAG: tRNA pseudouridine(55) synthase [uncultured Thermomicrobiales bacterium]
MRAGAPAAGEPATAGPIRPGLDGEPATVGAARPRLDGYLVLDKPAGWTSFDVVARVRRLLGERKIGHAGTLDPAATGVLPIAVGSARKTLEYLAGAAKTYVARVTFGVETETEDAEGKVTAVRDAAALDATAVEAALVGFLGPQAQIPPMYAAVKVGGQRLYEIARRGETIERAPRPVVFHRLELLAWESPTATLLVDCSKGTYVRALARDLGAALGPGAHLSGLIRTRTGPFRIEDAIALEALAELPLSEAWLEIAVPSDAPILDLPALHLDPDWTRRWLQGSPIPAAGVTGECRAYGVDGEWLGIGRAAEDGTSWRPAKVVAAAVAWGSAT